MTASDGGDDANKYVHGRRLDASNEYRATQQDDIWTGGRQYTLSRMLGGTWSTLAQSSYISGQSAFTLKAEDSSLEVIREASSATVVSATDTAHRHGGEWYVSGSYGSTVPVAYESFDRSCTDARKDYEWWGDGEGIGNLWYNARANGLERYEFESWVDYWSDTRTLTLTRYTAAGAATQLAQTDPGYYSGQHERVEAVGSALKHYTATSAGGPYTERISVTNSVIEGPGDWYGYAIDGGYPPLHLTWGAFECLDAGGDEYFVDVSALAAAIPAVLRSTSRLSSATTSALPRVSRSASLTVRVVASAVASAVADAIVALKVFVRAVADVTFRPRGGG